MASSNNVIRTVKQFPKGTHTNLKKPMFYVVTGLFLMTGMQAANAEVCAPDVGYLIPKLRIQDLKSDAKSSIQKNFIDGYKSGLCCSNGGHEDPVVKTQREFEGYIRDANVTLEHPDMNDITPKEYKEDWILINKERIKQLNCMKNSGQVADTSSGFDTDGNYKSTTQLASNKKSKSGKGNNQEQVATANSNENGTNSTDSNNAESSDSKSKGKEFAKDEKRLHANSCVAVQRDKNKVPAFKNICPYPIEVVWCANSKDDPNQCDRGWYGQWNFGVGHSEPINATSATHWVVAACKGENSLYMNEELKRNRKVRCVNWKN